MVISAFIAVFFLGFGFAAISYSIKIIYDNSQ
jgi:hypothetical protein